MDQTTDTICRVDMGALAALISVAFPGGAPPDILDDLFDRDQYDRYLDYCSESAGPSNLEASYWVKE